MQLYLSNIDQIRHIKRLVNSNSHPGHTKTTLRLALFFDELAST